MYIHLRYLAQALLHIGRGRYCLFLLEGLSGTS